MFNIDADPEDANWLHSREQFKSRDALNEWLEFKGMTVEEFKQTQYYRDMRERYQLLQSL